MHFLQGWGAAEGDTRPEDDEGGGSSSASASDSSATAEEAFALIWTHRSVLSVSWVWYFWGMVLDLPEVRAAFEAGSAQLDNANDDDNDEEEGRFWLTMLE